MRLLRVGAALALGAILVGAGPGAAAQTGKSADTGAAEQEARLEAMRLEIRRLTDELRRIAAEVAELAALGPGSGEERIRTLDAQLAKLDDELRQLTERVREIDNLAEALARDRERRISLTVYGDLQVSNYGGESSVLDGQLVELVLGGRPHKALSFVAQVEFERAAAVGGEQGGRVVVEQAYATLSLGPLLNFRAGVFLMPFGNIDVDHFPSKRDVVNRPLVSVAVAPHDWSDNGFGLAGQQLVGENWLVSYETVLGAGLASQITDVGLRDARQGYGFDNNGNKALVGRVAMNRFNKVELGFSGYSGKYDDQNHLNLLGWAIDHFTVLGPVKISGEYDSFRAARDLGPDARYRGGYLRGVYEFGRSWLAHTPLGRNFDDPRLAFVFQYERIAIDGPSEGRLVHNGEQRATWGLNYRPSQQWVLKVNYERNATENRSIRKGDKDGWVGSVAFVF